MASKDATGEAQRHIIGLATPLSVVLASQTWPARIVGLAVGSPWWAWPPSCGPRAS